MKRLARRISEISAVLTTMLFITTPSFAQGAESGGGNIAPYFFSGTALMVVIGGLVIFLLFVLSRSVSALHQGFSPPHKTAMEILRERYARGEMNREEFEEKRSVLQH